MIGSVIWTNGATHDYLEADPSLAPTQAIDAIIELLRLFPDMGVPATRSRRIRRALIGRKRVYGLYYATDSLRLIVLALIDLRQDPARIEQILESRGIES